MESRAAHTHPKNTQGPPPPPPPAKPLFLFPPFPSPFDCCLLHQLFLKMVESFQFYYTFVLTTYMALGCQYISSVPTAITDHNMTQGSQDISWGHTWSTDLFLYGKSARCEEGGGLKTTHRLGPWRKLTVQIKPHLIFLCHDFYWHKRVLNLKIGACSARTAVIPIIQYGGKRVH